MSDDGTIRGADLGTDGETKLRNTLAGVRDLGDHCIHRLDVDGRTVVTIGVARRQDGFAQLASGPIKERRGASNHTLLGAQLADFVARRMVRTVETVSTPVRPAEIDPDLARELAKAWQWPMLPDGPLPELLDHLRDGGFVVHSGDGDRLSVAGVLYLLADPTRVLGKAFVEVFRYRGDGRGETLTNAQVRELFGVDAVGARAALRRLRDRRLLQQRGTRRGSHYVLPGSPDPEL